MFFLLTPQKTQLDSEPVGATTSDESSLLFALALVKLAPKSGLLVLFQGLVLLVFLGLFQIFQKKATTPTEQSLKNGSKKAHNKRQASQSSIIKIISFFLCCSLLVSCFSIGCRGYSQGYSRFYKGPRKKHLGGESSRKKSKKKPNPFQNFWRNLFIAHDVEKMKDSNNNTKDEDQKWLKLDLNVYEKESFCTPLRFACLKGHYLVVKYLIECRANVNSTIDSTHST